ncbi:MAG: hypothetical protein GY868_14330, partial [Deltaproteobacteria bacterium]|nr:hypothetical protein [Deltaproteobacteria bacterium]
RELEAYIPETIGEMLPALAEARNILMTQNSFAGLTSHERGECLTRLVQDDSCLGELYEARHAGTLGDYLRCYLERSKE